MGEHVEFPSNGGTVSGYLVHPDMGAGLPIIVIQEWWGLVPHIRDVCDRFAAEGFTALAPDLYHGQSTREPDEAGKLMMALNMDQAAKDMSGAVDFLKGHEGTRGDGVGVVGFCMGGGLAMVLACHRPDAITACVAFYGIVPWKEAQPDWTRLDAAILGHIAGDDAMFTPEAAQELEQMLTGLGKKAHFHVYPHTDHAFFNDTRPEVYDADASALAWTRTLDFFRQKLG